MKRIWARLLPHPKHNVFIEPIRLLYQSVHQANDLVYFI